MPIKMTPPAMVTLRPSACDKRCPMSMADRVMTAAMIPITTAGHQMAEPKSPRLNPTPKASMLVARLRATRLSPRVGSVLPYTLWPPHP
jgi:hypothetical protein